MIGTMSPEEIDETLRRQRIGRIACSVDDRPYVVPITYAYDGDFVYSISTVGRKIDVMRAQPRVCFEVEEIDGPSTWRCVVAEGVYEELRDDSARRAALAQLGRRNGQPVPRVPDLSRQIVVFRLRLMEKSGRFERCDA